MILAISAAVIGVALSNAYRAAADARDYRRAAALLDELATKVDLIGPSRLMSEGSTEGTFEPPDDRFSWRASISTRIEGHLHEVTLEVGWPGRNGPRTAELRTLLNDPPFSHDPTLRWGDL